MQSRSAVALVIGIGSYQVSAGRVPELPCAVHDAEEIAKALVDPAIGGFSPNSVTVLLDGQATREQIVTELSEDFPARAKGAELALIYFAGHGILKPGNPPEGFLIPVDWDGQSGKLVARSVPMRDVARYVGAIEANAVVLILDCCHAAHVGIRERQVDSVSLDREIRLPPAALRDLPEFRGKGRYLLVSCDEGQTSLEMDDLQHGLFTYYLLKGLRSEAAADAQGRVSLDSLFDYLKRSVAAEAARKGKNQTPWRSFEGGGDVHLGIRTQPAAPKSSGSPEFLRMEELWRDLGPIEVIAEIEKRMATEDDEYLLCALKFLAEKADVNGVCVIFRSLTCPNEKVRRYAQTALQEIGWDDVARFTRETVHQGDTSRIDILLDGLNGLAAHAEPLRVLELLVDLPAVPPTQKMRAIELTTNKRLRLREEEVATTFRSMDSRYEILRALGQGAITASYLARHEQLQRDFVVRVLLEHYAEMLDVRTRFMELSGWAAGFRDGSVLRTIDLVAHSDRKIYYAVRDYIDGLTLREVLDGGTHFDPLQSIRILRKLAEALVDIHRTAAGTAGRPHGGMKPSNVFLTRDNRVVLGDPSILFSNALLAAGTWHAYDVMYLAPEVFGSSGWCTASDMYSLGCIAYELFCGRPPFVAETAMDVMVMHKNIPPRKPSIRGSAIGERADEVVMRLLEKNPSNRYADAAALLEALEDLGQSFRTQPPPRSEGGEPPAPDEPFEPDQPPLVGQGSIAVLDSGEFDERVARRSGVNLELNAYITMDVTIPPKVADWSESRRTGVLRTTFGRYQIEKIIGSGGMGEVYLAFDPVLKRRVAIKILRAEVSMNQMLRDRFAFEGKAIAAIEHPGIVRIYDVGVERDAPYIVMDYINGQSLRDLIQGGQLDQNRIARIMSRVARSISAVHRLGIIHRDLKPGNVMLRGNDEPVILDFGLALAPSEYDSRQTSVGQIIGTPAYMSPEQAAGAVHSITPQTDIYALGATLYELLAGRPPFSGRPFGEIVREIFNSAPTPLHELNPRIPRDLDAICLKCLNKRPEDRYATAGELADDLDRFLENRSVSALPEGIAGRVIRWMRRLFDRS